MGKAKHDALAGGARTRARPDLAALNDMRLLCSPCKGAKIMYRRFALGSGLFRTQTRERERGIVSDVTNLKSKLPSPSLPFCFNFIQFLRWVFPNVISAGTLTGPGKGSALNHSSPLARASFKVIMDTGGGAWLGAGSQHFRQPTPQYGWLPLTQGQRLLR